LGHNARKSAIRREAEEEHAEAAASVEACFDVEITAVRACWRYPPPCTAVTTAGNPAAPRFGFHATDRLVDLELREFPDFLEYVRSFSASSFYTA
jgi:hypothetical protein